MLGCKQSVAKSPMDSKGQQAGQAGALASSLAAKNNYSELASLGVPTISTVS